MNTVDSPKAAQSGKVSNTENTLQVSRAFILRDNELSQGERQEHYLSHRPFGLSSAWNLSEGKTSLIINQGNKKSKFQIWKHKFQKKLTEKHY